MHAQKRVHETMVSEHAIIDPSARIAKNVTIGPWTYIGPNVEIGEGTWIGPHVVVRGPSKIGKFNKIFQFASVGEDPQDKKYNGEETYMEMGDHNVVREFCTINRGTIQGGGITKIGNHNLFMACVHIAHDCIVHDDVVFANYAALAGHVVVNSHSILSGYSGVHQFCTVGAYSFIAKSAMVTMDVLPYVKVSGIIKPVTHGLNLEGLRRHAFSPDTIQTLKNAYKIIFREGLTVSEAIERLRVLEKDCPEVSLFISGLEQSSRGIVR